MALFKKKDEFIEAIKWNGWQNENILEILEFVGEADFEIRDYNIYIKTNGIGNVIKEGQYIVKGSLGYIYGMDEEVFKKYYEPV